MKSLLIKNAEIKGKIQDILIKNGLIEKISPEQTATEINVFDAKGCTALPGLIDMHCHICEPGYEQREDIRSASAAAARGGFTSITCMPVTKPVVDNKTEVNYILTRSQEISSINIYPYGSLTLGGNGEKLSDIGEMVKAGIRAVVNNGDKTESAVLLRNALTYSRMFDVPLITICNDSSLSDGGVINKGAMSVRIGLKGIPYEAEETIVARNIILAGHTNARVHIAMVSTRGSVELIRTAKRNGINVTCDTCPHYFILTEDAVDSYNTYAKVMPPLRTLCDAEALIEGLADGTIDAVSSGHMPDTAESKKVEFDRASFGVSALETAFAAAYTALVTDNVLSVEDLAGKMSENPAKILQMSKKGRLDVGYDGDIVIVNTDAENIVDASAFVSKAKYSPLDGKKMKCRIEATFVGGNIVYNRDIRL